MDQKDNDYHDLMMTYHTTECAGSIPASSLGWYHCAPPWQAWTIPATTSWGSGYDSWCFAEVPMALKRRKTLSLSSLFFLIIIKVVLLKSTPCYLMFIFMSTLFMTPFFRAVFHGPINSKNGNRCWEMQINRLELNRESRRIRMVDKCAKLCTKTCKNPFINA